MFVNIKCNYPTKMLPNSNPRTVFINPNFKNTHINPNFIISKPASSIHVNPAFLQKIQSSENVPQTAPTMENRCQSTNSLSRIISKSRTKIVRAPMMAQNQANVVVRSPLVKIGLRKLVRASAVLASQTKKVIPALASSPVKKGMYKIDRRIVKKSVYPKKLGRKREFVSKYALSRVNMDESLSAKRIVVTKGRLLKIGSGHLTYMKSKFSLTSSVNKKLELLNINGVLYKSTRTKLQKTDANSKPVEPFRQSTSGRVLFVRGDKFILDKSGHSLTRVEKPNYSKMNLKRIDIGGLTYVAKSHNVFIRTDTHKTRNHLSTAKQKSIYTLSKNMAKTNIPCAIFRKVGKCAAYDRGKCPKVHDRIQVSICPKFLKGECSNEKCLLSHNASLSKMPTCKFFLQGCCVRENCPYLHKKLSDSTEICIDFLRGFCSKADKCNKRHEFRCPDYEITGKCEKIKCVYCRKMQSMKPMQVGGNPSQKQAKVKEAPNSNDIKPDNEEKLGVSRYFVEEADTQQLHIGEVIIENRDVTDGLDESANIDQNVVIRRRPKLGILPAFIPL